MQEILKELTRPGFGSEGLDLSMVVPRLVIALVLSYMIALTYKKINREREDHQGHGASLQPEQRRPGWIHRTHPAGSRLGGGQ